MPRPIPSGRRAWIAAWVVLCAAGLAATYGLNTSSEPDPKPEKPVSAQCAKLIDDIEGQLARNKRDGKGGGAVAFSRVRNADGDDCGDALHEHFGGHGSAVSGSPPAESPARVYSSCLAADTRPLTEGDDPCRAPEADGR
ncbi:hypothetical protein [Streptomyces sp. NPDC051684]|uniref:hypothetical protein n=1 Tax=Streptomyces sp. NPDC051684 TaxID=3365670 RepID=UPI003791EEF0